MYCKNCGAENTNGDQFCKQCGSPLEEKNDSNYGNVQNNAGYNNANYGNAQNNVNYNNMQNNNANYGNVQRQFVNTNMIPSEYKPISMWGYFGYELLFAIPCIGWILLLVFAFGGTQNVNLRNFARSYFCGLILVVVSVAIFMIICLATGVFQS